MRIVQSQRGGWARSPRARDATGARKPRSKSRLCATTMPAPTYGLDQRPFASTDCVRRPFPTRRRQPLGPDRREPRPPSALPAGAPGQVPSSRYRSQPNRDRRPPAALPIVPASTSWAWQPRASGLGANVDESRGSSALLRREPHERETFDVHELARAITVLTQLEALLVFASAGHHQACPSAAMRTHSVATGDLAPQQRRLRRTRPRAAARATGSGRRGGSVRRAQSRSRSGPSRPSTE